MLETEGVPFQGQGAAARRLAHRRTFDQAGSSIQEVEVLEPDGRVTSEEVIKPQRRA